MTEKNNENLGLKNNCLFSRTFRAQFIIFYIFYGEDSGKKHLAPISFTKATEQDNAFLRFQLIR